MAAVKVDLESLRTILERPGGKVSEDFQTAKEWQEQLGLSEKKCSEMLHQLLEKGYLEVSRRKVTSISGAGQWRPVYKINLPKGGKSR